MRTGSSTEKPVLKTVNARSGKVVHTYRGAAGAESYVRIKNPLNGKAALDGVSVSFWVRQTDEDKDGAMISFFDTKTKNRLYITGNCNIVFTSAGGDTLDINNPSAGNTTLLKKNAWAFITLTFSRTEGIKLYVNGTGRLLSKFTARQGGNKLTRLTQFDFTPVLEHMAACTFCYLGYGTPAGSLDADYDDLFLHSRPLARDEVKALYTMASRVYDFSSLASGVPDITSNPAKRQNNAVYDPAGRKANAQKRQRGIYVVDGKKIFIK